MKSIFIFLVFCSLCVVGAVIYGQQNSKQQNPIIIEVVQTAAARAPEKPIDPPQIAIILAPTDNFEDFTMATNELPAEVAFIIPASSDKAAFYSAVNSGGHPALLELLLEPNEFPATPAGPHTLLIGVTEQENLDKLSAQLSGGFAYSGVINMLSDRFVNSSNDFRPVLKRLAERGLVFVNADGTQPVFKTLDASLSKNVRLCTIIVGEPLQDAEVDAAIKALESKAARDHKAIGIFRCYANIIKSLKSWIEKAKQSGTVRIVPITAI